ncbi:hypothetical protein MMC12_005739 [Toensbergia leucococca]|nr:hypothetical protein [Toensbergia leucococca]
MKFIGVVLGGQLLLSTAVLAAPFSVQERTVYAPRVEARAPKAAIIDARGPHAKEDSEYWKRDAVAEAPVPECIGRKLDVVNENFLSYLVLRVQNLTFSDGMPNRGVKREF